MGWVTIVAPAASVSVTFSATLENSPQSLPSTGFSHGLTSQGTKNEN